MVVFAICRACLGRHALLSWAAFFVAFFTLVVILDKSRGAEPLFAWNDLDTTVNRRLGDLPCHPHELFFFFFHAFDSSLLLVSSRALLFYHFLFDQLVGDINVLVTSHDSPGHTHPVVHYCTAFRTLLQYLTKFDSAAPIQDRLFMTGEIHLCARAFVCVYLLDRIFFTLLACTGRRPI